MKKFSSLAVAKASSMIVEKLYDLGWTVVENDQTKEIVICETVGDDDDMLDEDQLGAQFCILSFCLFLHMSFS